MTSPNQPENIAQGRYPVRKILGQGGMATVYRVHDEMLQVDRAIKVLSSDLAQNEKIRTRFLSEARTMARLKHPNIVGVFDVGMEGDTPFIVMEIIDGGSVMDWINTNGPVTPSAAAWITIGLLNGLQHAHENGIIHRDIKPHNLLLTRAGRTKLTDFGIAHVGNTDISLTRTGSVMGTMAYMSPEQRRNAKETGIHSDIYSTGATLYVMLTGEEPFDLYSTDLYEELYQGIEGPLCDVIQKACSYKTGARYASAQEMRDALLAIVGELPGGDSVTDEGLLILNRSETACWEPDEPSHDETLKPGSQSTTQTGTLDFDHFRSDIQEPRHIETTPSIGTWLVIGAVVLAIGAVGLHLMGDEPTITDPAFEASTRPETTTAPVTPPDQEKGIEAVAETTAASQPSATPVERQAKPDPSAQPSTQKRTSRVKKPAPKKTRQTSTPTPAAAAPTTPEPAASTETGRVKINSRPYSAVYVNGRNMGNGFAGSLPVGTHTIKLVRPAPDNRTHTHMIRVEKDREVSWCWSFNDNAKCPRRQR